MTITISEGQKRLEALSAHFDLDKGFKQRPQVPVVSNWASKLATPCERWLYYNRTAWDKKEPRNWKGVGRLGNVIHDLWKMDMMEKGYTVIHGEMPLSQKLRELHQIGGKIDGRIGKGQIPPMLYEFKTMNERDYGKIDTWDDIVSNRKDYIKEYAGQIQIYLYDHNEEAGFLILCNKATLEWKWIEVYLDYGLAEWLLGRAERTNKAVKANIPPARIPYGSTCARCDFRFVCLPDVKNEGLEIVDLVELETILGERAALEDSYDRYRHLDDESKLIAKQYGKDFLVGTAWKAEFIKRQETRIDTKLIPLEERGKYEVARERVEVKFVPLSRAKI